MRTALLVTLLLGLSAAVVVWQRGVAAEAARAETVAEIDEMLSDAAQRADRYANSAERVLRPLPVMTAREEDALRRFRNAAHVARARVLGERVTTREGADSLVDVGRLIELEDSTQHWIVRRGTSPAHVVPELRGLLELLGERFHARLADLGAPPYRIEITSALRTAERQARLRETNANAASGVSSHEFGTTVDISYAAFAPPAAIPSRVLEGAAPEFAPHLERFTNLALESVSARKSRELGAILSQVLTGAQDEGLALVIYERQQTVYHLTVADTVDFQDD